MPETVRFIDPQHRIKDNEPRTTDIREGFRDEDAIARRYREDIPREVAERMANITVGIQDNRGEYHDQFDKIVQELKAEGRSEDVDRLRETLLRERDEERSLALEEIIVDEDFDPHDIDLLLNAYDRQREEDEFELDSMWEDFVVSSAMRDDPRAMQSERIVQTSIFDQINEERETRQKLNEMMDRQIAQSDVSADALAKDFGELMVPFFESSRVAQVAREMFGEDVRIRDRVFQGRFLQEQRQKFWDLEPEERMELFEGIIEFVAENSSMLQSDNDYQTFMMLQSILDEPDPDTIDWDRVMRDVVGIADVVALGSVARGVSKAGRAIFGRVSKNSVLSGLTRSNPKAAREQARAASESHEAARRLGTTKEDVNLERVMPKPRVMDASRGPTKLQDEDLFRFEEELLERGQNVLDKSSGLSLQFNERAFVDSIERIRRDLSGIRGAHLHNDKSKFPVRTYEDGYDYHAVFGRSKDYGFKNPETARRGLQDNFGHSAPKNSVLYRVNRDGDLEEVLRGDDVMEYRPGDLPDGEYFIGLNQTHRMDPTVDRFIFGDDNVFTVAGSGMLGRIYAPPTSQFVDRITRPIMRAQDVGLFVQRELQTMMRPYVNMTQSKKRQVDKILHKGRAEERNYSFNDLVDMGIEDPDVIRGYIAARKTADAVYAIMNRQVYRDTKRKGMMGIYNERFGTTEIARPMTREQVSESDAFSAYSMANGEIAGITTRFADDLYARGGRIARLNRKKRHGGEETDYVIMDPRNREIIDELPHRILSYREGYFPRIYRDHFIIEQSAQVSRRNGIAVSGRDAQSTRAVHTAQTRREAEDLVRRLNEEAVEGESFSWREAREISPDDARPRDVIEFEAMESAGGLFYSRRGEHLTRGDGALAPTEDSIESLQRAVQAASRNVEMRPLLEGMKKDWIKNYGHITGGRWPTDKSQIIARGPDREKAEQAKALWDYITKTAGVMDPSARAWKSFANNLANWVEGTSRSQLGGVLAEGARRTIRSSPIRAVTSTAFSLFLAGNPHRQVFLQSQQFLYVAGIDPGLAGRVPKDMFWLRGGLAAWDRPNMWPAVRERGARAMNMTEDEFANFVREFRESGLPFSLDSNLLTNQGFAQIHRGLDRNIGERALRYGRNVLKSPLSALRFIGFDQGELNNLALTWAFARRRYIRDNPELARIGNGARLSARQQEEVGAIARDMSLSMTAAGAPGYQHGWGRMMMQFFAIQHKAMLGWMPRKLGGHRNFTPQEKRRIFLGNALLYGTSGLGIREAWEMAKRFFGIEVGEDIDEATDSFALGGLTEMGINLALQAFDDPEVGTSRVAYSSEFAPASGVIETPAEMMRAAWSGERSLAEVFTGAGGQGLGRISDMLQMQRMIFADPELDTDEKILESLQTAPMVLSGYNNYMQARYAMRMGEFVDGSHNRTVRATYNEALVKGTLGIDSYATRDLWESRMSVSRMINNLNEIGDTYHDRIMRRVFLNQNVDNVGEWERQHLLEGIRQEATIMHGLDEWERQIVHERVLRNMEDARTRGDEDLAEMIARFATDGGEPPRDYIYRHIKNNEAIPPEKREAIMRAVDSLFSEEGEQMFGPGGPNEILEED